MKNKQRLYQKITDLERQWNLLSEKLSRLEQDRILETDTEAKFKLEHSIDELKAERQDIEQQLSDLEAQLHSEESAGTASDSTEKQELLERIRLVKLEQEKQKHEHHESDFCFVIMPFSDDLKIIYDLAIKPAVESTGLKCIRVDEIHGGGSILRDIVECTHNAKVVIADLTGKNANVLYELGLAHALDNNVIMLAQSPENDVPFDLNNYRVIQYNMKMGGDIVLKEEIQKAIESLDKWTQKPSNPIQDFLSPDARPVTGSEHKAVKQELENVQQELRETHTTLEHYKVQQDDFQRVKEENAKLQGRSQFADALIREIIGKSVESPDSDEILKRFYAEMDKEGEMTVSVPSPTEDGKTDPKKRKKVTFRKVEPAPKSTKKSKKRSWFKSD